MSDSTPAKVLGLSGPNLAFLSLRLWLGVRALVAGVEKFSGKVNVEEPLLDATGMPDASGAMLSVEHKVYGFAQYHALPETLKTKFTGQPLLPEFLADLFYPALGPALILLGLALLLGVQTRLALLLMALLYTMLTFGLMLIGQDEGVSWLAIHVGLIAFALTLVDQNRFALTRK